MKTIQISKPIEKELESIPRWKFMLYLQEKGESPVYQISKELGWNTGKTHSIVTSLLKSEAVKTRTVVRNGRALKLVRLIQ